MTGRHGLSMLLIAVLMLTTGAEAFGQTCPDGCAACGDSGCGDNGDFWCDYCGTYCTWTCYDADSSTSSTTSTTSSTSSTSSSSSSSTCSHGRTSGSHYSTTAGPGQTISATLYPSSSADWDMTLYDPYGSSVAGSYAGTGSTDSFNYAVPSGGSSGSFVLCVYFYSGSGSYSLSGPSVSGTSTTTSTTSSTSTTSAPPPPPPPPAGSHGRTSESHYSTSTAGPGQTVSATLYPASTADWDMSLYDPNGTQVTGSYAGTGSTDSFSYAIPSNGPTGSWLVCVYYYSGSGSYSFSGPSVSGQPPPPPDTTQPTVSISPSGTSTTSSSITFTVTFSESVTGFTSGDFLWSGVGATQTSFSGSGASYSVSLSVSSSGTITCVVPGGVAADAAGNSNQTSNYASVTFSFDTTPPGAPIGLSVSPGGWTNSNSYTLSWSNPSDASGISSSRWKRGSAPTSNSDYTGTGGSGSISGVTYNQSGSGYQYVYVWLVDGAGNASYSSYATAVLYYDATSPSVYANGSTTVPYTSNISITLYASDGNSGLSSARYKWDGDGNASTGTAYSNGATTTIPSGGNHTLYLWGQDAVGNTSSWGGSYSLNLPQIFTYALAPGQSVSFTVSPTGTTDWDIRLKDPSGTIVTGSYRGAGLRDSISYTVPPGAASGSWTVEVFPK